MLRILLVEDSPFDASLAMRRMDGFALVDAHATLTSALAAAKHKTYDAVVLDLNLPDSHGMHTVEAFIHSIPPLPILVCSTNPEALGELSEWVDTVMAKPLHKRALLDALNQITDRISQPYLQQSTQRIFESLQMLRQIAHGL
jgi:DNA-binding response OmpR family regulator